MIFSLLCIIWTPIFQGTSAFKETLFLQIGCACSKSTNPRHYVTQPAFKLNPFSTPSQSQKSPFKYYTDYLGLTQFILIFGYERGLPKESLSLLIYTSEQWNP